MTQAYDRALAELTARGRVSLSLLDTLTGHQRHELQGALDALVENGLAKRTLDKPPFYLRVARPTDATEAVHRRDAADPEEVTRRDAAAHAALAGFLKAYAFDPAPSPDELARRAYELADALERAR